MSRIAALQKHFQTVGKNIHQSGSSDGVINVFAAVSVVAALACGANGIYSFVTNNKIEK